MDIERYTLHLPGYGASVEKCLKLWTATGFSRRLWNKNTTLWTGKPELEVKNRLGWLKLPDLMEKELGHLTSFAEDIRRSGFEHVLLLGMGGSSLAAEVFQDIFRNRMGFPELIVLDSTHPESVLSCQKHIDLRRTLFLVSSKSGNTLETLSFFYYFWDQLAGTAGNPGRNFVAITDPESPLEQLAHKRDFRAVFLAPRDVGGRFSALSVFGLLPAALIGMDLHNFVSQAKKGMEINSSTISEEKAPGFVLGAALGELSKSRDKMSVLTPPELSSFPFWLEQLLAESLGKNGKGLIPVVGEPFLAAENYKDDRFFVYFSLDGARDRVCSDLAEDLVKKGFPMIQISLKHKYELAREIFAWEIATTAAGAVMGVHPFTQEDVLVTKELTWRAMEAGRRGEGRCLLPGVEEISGKRPELSRSLNRWLSLARPGDYIGLQAYLQPNEKIKEQLQNIRLALTNRTSLATTLGFGPRFLHSTGQLHKGGPNTGLFLQLVDEPDTDIPVPESEYTFGRLIQAQSIGDFLALKERGRRILRIKFTGSSLKGLEDLEAAIQKF